MKTSLVLLALSCVFSFSAFAKNECNVYSAEYNALKASQLSAAKKFRAQTIKETLGSQGYKIVSKKEQAALEITSILTYTDTRLGRSGRFNVEEIEFEVTKVSIEVIDGDEKTDLVGSDLYNALIQLPKCK